MASLFDPLELRSLTIRNRVGMSPMCVYSCEKHDGVPTPWQLVHYGARALGGCGFIIVEATAIEPRGRITLNDAGIWADFQVRPWHAITKVMIDAGAIPCIQLAHAGRKGGMHPPFDKRGLCSDEELSNTPQGLDALLPVAPSPIAFDENFRTPIELTPDDLMKMVDEWESATRRARVAGFLALELHMAHGYLLHEFLSPITNKRTDMFGGDFNKRIHFPLMITQAVRLAWPDNLPLVVRLSCSDCIDGGWTLDDSVEFCKRLRDIGVDLIDCSSRGIAPNSQGSALGGGKQQAGYHVPFAERILKETGIPTAVVGMISEPSHANEIIQNGQASMVLLGRELLRNPQWAISAALELDQQPPWPRSYRWALDRKQ